MPTLNEAAVTLRLRAALMKSLSNLYAVRISECHAPNAKTAERYSFTNEADANEVEAAIDLMRSALAADPGPLVAAVEGVVGALEGIRTVLSGAAPIDRGIALQRRDREEIAEHLKALTAYRAALGGTDEPR